MFLFMSQRYGFYLMCANLPTFIFHFLVIFSVFYQVCSVLCELYPSKNTKKRPILTDGAQTL